ncbi:41895_t:CDS:2 [Gigaspora margarita]|uniref:41895_t:CDS:1 n=1 Tax=Gigaspora margarita TaxID=4874 RepID=A0ABN7US84_GIGMA|nr:41895_t:CDS:2 [Gigaspora margarita]
MVLDDLLVFVEFWFKVLHCGSGREGEVCPYIIALDTIWLNVKI